MDWKKTFKKVLFTPIWLVAVLSVLSAAGLILVFTQKLEQTPLAYGIYVLSAYALTVLTLLCIQKFPEMLQRYRQKKDRTPTQMEKQRQTEKSLHTSLGINVLYVLVNLLSWYWNRSWWFVVLAGYYIFLSLIRFLLVRYVHNNTLGSNITGEWKRTRICSVLLLLINLSLSGAVLMILFQHRGYNAPGIMIYVMALYTFYSAIHPMVEGIRFRKKDSPVLSAVRTVSFSAALVSLINLETAMFAQFGGDLSPAHQRLFIILTGAGVSIVIVTLSLLLIVKATKEIRKNEQSREL